MVVMVGASCLGSAKIGLVETGATHSRIKTQVRPASGKGRQLHLMPGTVLIREWEEREHRVMVTPAGEYELDGQTFRSLSAAARQITGTQWNGPKFFGLREAMEGGR